MNQPEFLQQRILEAAWRYRFRPAVSGPGCRSVSHLGLVMRALGNARRLSAHPERLREPVALRFPKNTTLIEHLLGVLLAGGAYVCLDPNAGRGDWMNSLRVYGSQLLLHGRRDGPAPEMEIPPELLCLKRGSAWPLPGRRLKAWPKFFALVQTSGTSGAPCGVRQDADAVLHHAEWTIASQQIDERSRLSWVASPGVAAAHSHLYASLLSGACLCPFEPAKEGLASMTRWMRAERITHLHLTPSLLRAWLDSLPDGAEFPELRCVKLGGEPARSADARLLRRKLGSRPRLLNGLGMSEASGNITLGEITERDLEGDGLLPVGRPVDGRVVVVESEPGRVAGQGETGEIVVRDEWVSPGYLPAGARDTIRNTDDPCIRELRTGDAGRWDEEGRLVHLGRLDRRIRVRGMTVDLAEVEARVASLDAVRQVAAVPEAEGAGYRVAVVLRADTEAARREIKEFFKQMPGVRPVRVGFVADLPRKPNGKRDDDELIRHWPEDKAEAVWSGCEIYIRDAWARVLGHRDFGKDDLFSHVGGDSLSAMNLALELGRLAQREVGMTDLVRYPTVGTQALALEKCRLGVQTPRVVRDRFHVEWMHIPAPEPIRTALVHTGGYSREPDVWLVGSLLSGIAQHTSLMVIRSNIDEPHIDAPANWSEMVDPLMAEISDVQRPLLIGVCVGALVVVELAERLRVAGKTDVEMVLLDPWTPGMGRTAVAAEQGNHPQKIRRYYDIFKTRTYPEIAGLKHVILASGDSHFEIRKKFWSERVPTAACVHAVHGDHMSFVREHRNETARVLASLVRQGGKREPAERGW
ncbi:MAG: non-ribosomal peptide synthetase [Opitutaceae bacterium]|nr:non-ribosomal peptide synthetase [Opitutaceae bacterium]